MTKEELISEIDKILEKRPPKYLERTYKVLEKVKKELNGSLPTKNTT